VLHLPLDKRKRIQRKKRRIGVPAKRSKSDYLAPFSEAKSGGELIKNLVFAVVL
jgi:hypothetical protein